MITKVDFPSDWDNVASQSESTNVMFVDRDGRRAYVDCRTSAISLDSECSLYEVIVSIPLRDGLARSVIGHIRIFHMQRSPAAGFHNICRKAVVGMATDDFLVYLAGILDKLVVQKGRTLSPKVFVSVEQCEKTAHLFQLRIGFGSGEKVQLGLVCGSFGLDNYINGARKHLDELLSTIPKQLSIA